MNKMQCIPCKDLISLVKYKLINRKKYLFYFYYGCFDKL